MCIQLPEGLGAGGLDVVHCANVIQTTAGHQVTRGGEGDAHHPGRLQWHSNQLQDRTFSVLTAWIRLFFQAITNICLSLRQDLNLERKPSVRHQ